MRALITLIAILTVGIVTAQAPSFNIATNEIENVLPAGLSRADYVAVGDLRTDLRNFYPRGTSRVFQFNQDEIAMDNDIEAIHISPAAGVTGNGRQGYRIRFDFDGGTRLRFNAIIPTENILSNNRMEATLNSRRDEDGNYFPANELGNEYRAEVTLIWTKPNGQINLYVTATIVHPAVRPNTVGRRITYGFNVGPLPTTIFGRDLRQDVADQERIRPYIGADNSVTPPRNQEHGRQPNIEVVKQEGSGPIRTVATGVDVFLDYTFNHTVE